MSSSGKVTLLLPSAKADPEVLAQLIPLVYDELHQIAVRHSNRETPGHTLPPTAILHEAYFRLFPPTDSRKGFQNRAHFFAAASQAMGQVLMDHGRKKRAKKRGGEWQRVDMNSTEPAREERLTDWLALDQALNRLQAFNPLLARIVELRFFDRLTEEETATRLHMGASTVRRHWTFAKAWLKREIENPN